MSYEGFAINSCLCFRNTFPNQPQFNRFGCVLIKQFIQIITLLIVRDLLAIYHQNVNQTIYQTSAIIASL